MRVRACNLGGVERAATIWIETHETPRISMMVSEPHQGRSEDMEEVGSLFRCMHCSHFDAHPCVSMTGVMPKQVALLHLRER